MKISSLVARILLGLIFVVSGLNGFLHFISGPLPSGIAGQFIGALMQSHYDLVVSGLEFAGGLLLLINRFVPLALMILGPVIVNIFLFHLLMYRTGLALAIVVVILWGIIAFRQRPYFSALFTERTDK